mmetsp:Transcript_15093/g.30721  ORF Transcript_15093/g.30721 Transcript_15093/m.30721 type:complete len:673 (-) Transcript_15093:306-2324(-)
MVRLTALRAKQARGGFDTASYMTDTSSITNPVELGFSYDSQDHDEDEDDSYFEDYTSYAASSMTGWTTEAEESAFPVAHSKTGLSQQTSNSYENDDVTSCMISAISFEDGSIEASLMDGKNYEKTKKGKGSKLTTIREPLTEKGSSQPAAKAVQFRSPSNISLEGKKTPNLPLSPKSALKSKSVPQVDVKKATSFGSAGPTSPASSTTSSVVTRKPVPPLRDPTMEDSEEDQMWEEDCNYDINPTVMFLILESRDWKECIALLDGKTSEKNSWSLNHLFGGGKPDVNQMKERQKELKAQARTWIVRRERNGFLRWRMLPLHAALAFNAPFDVVLRLYHLYPGAMRCRNDKGMLPIHHVFYYGNEDRVLELFMDVFPEGLTVTDDKGRLPIACTPCDGSDNERRSSILNLYCNFHLSEAKKEAEKANNPPAAPLTVQPQQQLPQQQQQQQQQQHPTLLSSPTILRNGYIIDVDDNFFTTAFFTAGLFYSLGKAYNRYLLEEVAFEQRKLEARERRLAEDPTLDELDLRREESEGWTSVYGKRRRQSREDGSSSGLEAQAEGGRGRGSRTAVLERELEDDDDDEEEDELEDDEYGMTDDEIEDFESKWGVEYDPYFDEPYEESELPVGKYKEDKSYGDRRYENGEVFYKDEATGLFYRQGSRPRARKFWNLNSS